MKTKEELNAIKNEVEALNKKVAELSEDELKMVSGGLMGASDHGITYRKYCSNCGYILREVTLSGTKTLVEDGDLLSECPQCHEVGMWEWHSVN